MTNKFLVPYVVVLSQHYIIYKWQWIIFSSFFSCFLDVLSVVTWCNVIFRETIQIFCFLYSFLTLVFIVCTHTYQVVLILNSLCKLKKKNNQYEKTTACHQKKFHNPHYHSEQVCEIITSSNDKQWKGIKAFAFNQ